MFSVNWKGKICYSPYYLSSTENVPELEKNYEGMYTIQEPDKTVNYDDANKQCEDDSNGHLAVPDSKSKEVEMLAYAQRMMQKRSLNEIRIILGKKRMLFCSNYKHNLTIFIKSLLLLYVLKAYDVRAMAVGYLQMEHRLEITWTGMKGWSVIITICTFTLQNAVIDISNMVLTSFW